MSTLVKASSRFGITDENLAAFLCQIKEKLGKRVERAFVFGSASTGQIKDNSDIDLILVVKNPIKPFIERGVEFADLFEIYPDLDILVYTQDELDRQLADSDIGFWKSVRLTMREI